MSENLQRQPNRPDSHSEQHAQRQKRQNEFLKGLAKIGIAGTITAFTFLGPQAELIRPAETQKPKIAWRIAQAHAEEATKEQAMEWLKAPVETTKSVPLVMSIMNDRKNQPNSGIAEALLDLSDKLGLTAKARSITLPIYEYEMLVVGIVEPGTSKLHVAVGEWSKEQKKITGFAEPVSLDLGFTLSNDYEKLDITVSRNGKHVVLSIFDQENKTIGIFEWRDGKLLGYQSFQIQFDDPAKVQVVPNGKYVVLLEPAHYLSLLVSDPKTFNIEVEKIFPLQ